MDRRRRGDNRAAHAPNFANLRRALSRGLNFGVTETPFGPVWERFGGKTASSPHLGLNKAIHLANALEYLEHRLRATTHTRGLCILVAPDVPSPAAFDPDQVAGFVRQVHDGFARWR